MHTSAALLKQHDSHMSSRASCFSFNFASTIDATQLHVLYLMRRSLLITWSTERMRISMPSGSFAWNGRWMIKSGSASADT